MPTPGVGIRTHFLYVGRLIEDKHLDVIIEGFRVALEQGSLVPSAKLLLVGSGPDRERLVHVAGDLLGSSVVFVGEVFDRQIRLQKLHEVVFALGFVVRRKRKRVDGVRADGLYGGWVAHLLCQSV